MLTVYMIDESLYCAKLRIMMRHKGIKWHELPPPGGYGSAEYKAVVPSGNLPAMVEGDFMLSDSEAIAEYLNEAYTAVPMLPDDIRTRAKAREKGRFHDTRLEPALRALFPHVAYETRDPKAVKTAGELISKHLEALALLLADPALPQDRLWLCDCGFAVTFTWIKAFEMAIGLQVKWPESVLAYDQRLNGFAAVITEHTAYRPAMEAYLEKAKAA